MLRDVKLTKTENFILAIRGLVQNISIPEVRAMQLDSTNTVVEQVPIVIYHPVERKARAGRKR